MNRLFLIPAFMAFIVLFMSSVYATDFSISTPVDTVYLQHNYITSIPVTIQNYSSSEKELTLKADTSNYMLKVYPSLEKISLSANQQTTIGIQVFPSQELAAGKYDIVITAVFSDEQITKNVAVQLQTANFNAVVAQSPVCISDNVIVKLQIENKSNTGKTLKVEATDEMFLPIVDPNEIRVDSLKSKFVDLRLHAGFADEGVYKIPVTITDGRTVVTKDVSVELVDCKEQGIEDIDVWFNKNCLDVPKTETKKLNFYVKNNSSKNLSLGVELETDLDARLTKTSFDLMPDESQEGTIEINTDDDTTAGKRDLKLLFYNGNEFILEKEYDCINVIPKNLTVIDASALEGKEISLNTRNIFQIKVTNKGDMIEDYELSLSQISSGINATLDKNVVSIAPGGEIVAYLRVESKPNATAGRKTVKIKAEGTRGTQEQSAEFILLNSVTSEGQIEILSWPEQINISPGEEKEAWIKVKNAKENELNNLVLSINSLPDYLHFSAEEQMHIQENEERLIKTLLKANGNSPIKSLDLVLEASSQGVYERKDLRINILFNPETAVDENLQTEDETALETFAVTGMATQANLSAFGMGLFLTGASMLALSGYGFGTYMQPITNPIAYVITIIVAIVLAVLLLYLVSTRSGKRTLKNLKKAIEGE